MLNTYQQDSSTLPKQRSFHLPSQASCPLPSQSFWQASVQPTIQSNSPLSTADTLCQNTLFEVDNLIVTAGDKTLLQVDKLTISHQKLTSFIGPNGAGKSTLLHSLLNHHGSSNLKVAGSITCPNYPNGAYARLTEKGHIAWVGQHERYELPLTVLEYALLGTSPQLIWYQAPNQQHVATAMQLLNDFELNHLSKARVHTLSGGEKQRLSIVRALMQDTSILMLDEPTNHLDIRHQRFLLTYLQNLVTEQQKTVLVVLHDLTHAYRYSDEVVLLHHGNLVMQGKPETVMTTKQLSEVYQVAIEAHDTAGGKVFV